MPDSAAAMGDGREIDAAIDAPASVSTAAIALAGGWAHTCALTSNHHVKCWGENDYGQLGTGGMQELHVPTEIAGLANVSAVVAANVHSCALTTTGSVSCWGRNTFGELGDGTNSDRGTPVPVANLASANTLAAGTYHTCAVTASGAVWCWGDNDSGQLGDGTLANRSAAVAIASLASGVTAVTLGTRHSCALLATGGVRCWGENEDGQLGDSSRTDRSSPVDVSGLSSGVIAIGAGDNFTCALLAAGTVSCWGGNDRSQLGGIAASATTPSAVAGIANATALTVGGKHACVLVGGGVKCWGYDNAGQLGNGMSSSTSSATPVDVIGLANGIVKLGAGYSHTCAMLASGSVMCWGDNVRGELGDGTVITRHAPVSVVGF